MLISAHRYKQTRTHHTAYVNEKRGPNRQMEREREREIFCLCCAFSAVPSWSLLLLDIPCTVRHVEKMKVTGSSWLIHLTLSPLFHPPFFSPLHYCGMSAPPAFRFYQFITKLEFLDCWTTEQGQPGGNVVVGFVRWLPYLPLVFPCFCYIWKVTNKIAFGVHRLFMNYSRSLLEYPHIVREFTAAARGPDVYQ